MTPRAARAYRSVDAVSSVGAAAPGELLLLVFERIDRYLATSTLQRRDGDHAGADESLRNAFDLMQQGLKATLDPTRGGAIAAQLDSLYDWATRELLKARLHREEKPAEDVRGVMAVLREGFETAVRGGGRPTAAPEAARMAATV